MVFDIAAIQLHIANAGRCRRRQRDDICRKQSADGDGAAIVTGTIDISQCDVLIQPGRRALNDIFFQRYGIQTGQSWLVIGWRNRQRGERVVAWQIGATSSVIKQAGVRDLNSE